MDSTAFDMILVPIVVVLAKTLAACWLASVLIRGTGRVAHRLAEGATPAGSPADFGDGHDGRDWGRPGARAAHAGPAYRRRLAS